MQLVGVQKRESFKKITKTKGGPERESVKKATTTSTYPYWDLLDLRFLQVGVLILTLK